jgi:hypothetical protein
LAKPDLGLDGVVEVQAVIEGTLVIVHVPTPAGVAPFVGPSTVAVKVIVLPIVAVPELGFTVTIGFALPTTTETFVDAGAVL